MIVTRFPYQKLSRKTVDGVRLYSCPNGDRLPSTTTILDKTKPHEKKVALENWRKRVGHANATAITHQSCSRGTKMHTFLENYICNDSLGNSGTNPFSIESYKMASHIVENSLKNVTEFYGSEVNLYYPSLFAGTTDCVALYKGELAIIDYKQSNKIKLESWIDDYKLQISSYILCHDILYNTQVKYGIIMMCTPKLEYQQWIIEGIELEKYKELWWKRLEQYYTIKFGL